MKIYSLLHLKVLLVGVVIYHFWKHGVEEPVIQACDEGLKSEDFKSNSNVVVRNSSVWCWGSNHLDRICYFHNLYLHSNEFFFVHGQQSSYYGLPENQFNPTLLDLSSVYDHNGQYFNFVDVTFEYSQRFLNSSIQVSDLTFALHRFHPDNLMHVFHDDLLPLFHTMDIFSPLFKLKFEEIQLLFMDKRSPGKYKRLYEIMTPKKLLFKSSFRNKTACFPRIFMGVLKNTTWYQYGFIKPQSPLLHDVNVNSLNKFIDFTKSKLNIKVTPKIKANSAVLLVRKLNRLILNEIELTYKLVHDLGLKVDVMSQETHDVVEIISKVSTSEVVIGMHGSLLIFSLFLPPGSLLVELFPYAINPENYTPYKTLVGLLGMNRSYASWGNTDARRTRTHPDRAPFEGGISHLPRKRRAEILSCTEVPLHLCCDDPRWLFRIYQDTEVDVDRIIESIANNRRDRLSSRSPALQPERHRLVPYRIRSIKCSNNEFERGLFISWVAPVNVESVGEEGFLYELWLQEVGTDHYLAFHSPIQACKLTTEDGVELNTPYYVWVRGVSAEHAVGPFNNFELVCSLHS